MKKNYIGIATTAILVILMVINVFLLIRTKILMKDNAVLRENKETYILPDGYTPAAIKAAWDSSSPSPSGWVVRYASNECIYCKLDFEWERLASTIERINYRTTIILPDESYQFNDDAVIPVNAQQIAFVNIEWIRQFRFTKTPVIIVFDNNGRVLWHHVGMLNEDDYKSAEKVIVKNSKG